MSTLIIIGANIYSVAKRISAAVTGEKLLINATDVLLINATDELEIN